MKFYSKPISEHCEVPLADEGEWEDIVKEWSQKHLCVNAGESSRCYILSISFVNDELIQKAQLDEIVKLTEAQGAEVSGKEVYLCSHVNPRSLIGRGTARAVAARARECQATMIVVDAALSPSQLRNLEDMAGMSICDREAIILNVFLKHASTKQARTQVEIAQLEYLRPRIRGIGINMDQQAGGIGNSRGAGETASELLARKLDSRLLELRKIQKKYERIGETGRSQRDTCRRIVLIGYTNAGKTSLMNALANEELSAKQMPFETLSTTSRCLSRHGADILLSDTVGFIRRLPESLLASFAGTLEEIKEASLLVLVTDVSDYEFEAHLRTTLEMLEKLGALSIPRYYVFNKVDRLRAGFDESLAVSLSAGHPYCLLSCHDSHAVAAFKESLLKEARSELQSLDVFVPYSATQVNSLIYSKCRVIENSATEEGLQFKIEGSGPVLQQILEELGKWIK